MLERIFFVLTEKNVRTKDLFATGGSVAFRHMWHFSLYSLPLVSLLFFFYCPSQFHIEDCLCVTSRSLLAVARFKFSLAYVKIYLDRVALGRPFVAFSLFLVLTLYLSAFPRYWDRALGGISSGADATFRINRPVGLKPVSESRNGGSLARVSARAATGSMRNAGSDEKEDWLETESVSAAGRRRYAADVGKSRLTIRGNSLRLSVLRRPPPPLPARRIFNGKIMRGICSREFPPSPFAGFGCDEGVSSALKQTYQFRFSARL